MVLISLKVYQSDLTFLLCGQTDLDSQLPCSSWCSIWKSSFLFHRPYRSMAERSLILSYVSTPSCSWKRKGWGRQDTWCSQPGCFYRWKQGSLSPHPRGTSLILLAGELSPSQKGSLYFVFNQLFVWADIQASEKKMSIFSAESVAFSCSKFQKGVS